MHAISTCQAGTMSLSMMRRTQASFRIASSRPVALCSIRAPTPGHTAQIASHVRPLSGAPTKSCLLLSANDGRLRLCAVRAGEGEALGSDVVEVEIKIEGMVCGSCSSRVAAALKAVDRVRSVDISLETKLARVDVSASSQMDALSVLETLVNTVNGMGFAAEPYFE